MKEFKQFEEYFNTQKWREMDDWMGHKQKEIAETKEFDISIFSGMVIEWLETKNIYVTIHVVKREPRLR